MTITSPFDMNKAAQRSKKLAQKTVAPKKVVKQQQRKATKKAPVKQSKRNVHVAVIGAAGGIGQPLSMIIKQNQNGLFTKLSLFDVNPLVNGVAADLSHIPTSVQVKGFTDIDEALLGADIVVVPAGVPRKPGMTRDDLFNVNASINFSVANAVARTCPNARNLIISNPVNSMVPLWSEVLKARGVYDPAKLMGVTTLDVFRATTFTHELQPEGQQGSIPVIGGHAGTTIVPLFSTRKVNASGPELEALVKRTMFGGDEVVQAKAGGGSATLSMASAGARFAEQVAQAIVNPTFETTASANLLNDLDTSSESGLAKKPLSAFGLIETLDYAFVQNSAAQKAFGVDFFASGVVLGPAGVVAVHPTWELANEAELKLVGNMVGDLKDQVAKGREWALNELANPTPPKA